MRNFILSISWLSLGLTAVAAIAATKVLIKDRKWWPFTGYALAEWSWVGILYLLTDRIILAAPAIPPNADAWSYLVGVLGLSVGFCLISYHSIQLSNPKKS